MEFQLDVVAYHGPTTGWEWESSMNPSGNFISEIYQTTMIIETKHLILIKYWQWNAALAKHFLRRNEMSTIIATAKTAQPISREEIER